MLALAVDVIATLHAVAARPLPAAPPDDGIPAIGACVRPSAEERDAMTKRIVAWLGKRYPREKLEAPGTVQFGCVEPSGTVVDVQVDGTVPRSKAPAPGHWLALRVGGAIGVLADSDGLSTQWWNEWAQETERQTIALVDLDGDGVLDLLSVEGAHEGGSSHYDLTLSAVLSKDGKAHAVAQFSDYVGAPWFPGRDVAAPVVLAITEKSGRVAYRCVGRDLTLGTCPAAALAKRHDAAQAARSFLKTAKALPDREELATELDLLSPTKAERDELLAAAPPTTDGQRLERRIEAFLEPPDDRTGAERMQASEAERAAYTKQLDTALGQGACAPSPQPQIAAWAKQHARQLAPRIATLPRSVTVTPRCAGYAWATWLDGEHRITALVYAEGARITGVWVTSFDDAEPSIPQLGPRAAFRRVGATVVGYAIAVDGKKAFAIANGVVIATREGQFDTLHVGYETFDGLIDDASTHTVLRATLAGFATVPPGDPVRALLGAREARERATSLLSGFDPATGHAHRDELAQALVVLGADPALVAAARAL